MTQDKKRRIAIDDIKLAAYLRAKQIPMAGVQRSGRYGCFYFDEDKGRVEMNNYMLGKALVEPKAFSAAIRELRSLVDSLPNENCKDLIIQIDREST